ncbi:AAA family ATPase [Helicobacter bilis]|uniref:AAA family ATPase n=1 Tax=Helicobacter bilis TaxID=37372 RepID=UPI00248DD6EE|nr:AAA family ATPase [Helicobacter bilis]
MFEYIKQSIEPISKIETKEQTFLCENFVLICENGLTMISGNSGKGKSFLSIQIALQLAMQHKTKSLLWLSEDSKSISKQRAELILQNIIKTNARSILNLIDICDEIPPAITESSLNNYINLFKPYQFIVIDPLIAFYDGDENSNTQARAFMNCLTKIAKTNKQSILITHHNTKQYTNEPSRSRGASAFIDAVRLAYEIDFINDENNKNEGKRMLKITKDNLGLKTKKRMARWHKINTNSPN